jgi:hypothetical protein
MMLTYKKSSTLIATLVLMTGVANAQLLPGTGLGNVKIQTTERTSAHQGITSPAGILVCDFASGDSRAAANFSEALVKRLRKAGQAASRGGACESAPADTLVVQGYFERIEKGNKLMRAGIGFGAGASKVQVHVDLALAGSTISKFEAVSTSSRKPGAALSMGLGAAPAVAAAVAVAGDQKQNVTGDVNRLAKQLSKQILEVMKGQGWIR